MGVPTEVVLPEDPESSRKRFRAVADLLSLLVCRSTRADTENSSLSVAPAGNWATAGASNGYRAILVTRQLTPTLISSWPGKIGFPSFISFSTSYLNGVMRH